MSRAEKLLKKSKEIDTVDTFPPPAPPEPFWKRPWARYAAHIGVAGGIVYGLNKFRQMRQADQPDVDIYPFGPPGKKGTWT